MRRFDSCERPPYTHRSPTRKDRAGDLLVSQARYQWAAKGDVNAFFGLMLDNVANLLLTVSLLHGVFEFPTAFALRSMIPGTAVGVLVGDLLFCWLAFRLARQSGRNTITAMPLGLDTPSTLGMIFFVLGPAFVAAKQCMSVEAAAVHTWHIGICAIFVSGIFKFLCAMGSNWIRRSLPRAGLLGSLAAIALVLISFLPLLEILHSPLVGLVSLAVVLTTLVARIELPWRIPGAVGSLLIGGVLYYAMQAAQSSGLLPPVLTLPPEPLPINPHEGLLPREWLAVFRFEWLSAFRESLHYLPIVIPFALATVVGGIDCTESAAAVGDEYDTGQVIAVEAFATLVASLCGGVIQTTPYIGHPAYKAMGGRAAYVLATALFVGTAGVFGYFGYLYVVIPKVTVYPILIFIGLEIASQSFHATPQRHYPAVVFACVPALAQLALIFIDKLLNAPAFVVPETVAVGSLLRDDLIKAEVQTVRILANGFIVTSLLWASSLAAIIDRRLWRAASLFVLAATCTQFGVMHSPEPGSPLFVPWLLSFESQRIVYQYTLGYLVVAGLLFAWGWLLQAQGVKPIESDNDNLAFGEHDA
jgi:AGZA family xanthine/uracil permease-like MFS transporter